MKIMFTKSRRGVFILFIIAVFVFSGITGLAYAQDDSALSESEDINVGVSTVCPDSDIQDDGGAQIKGVQRPSKVWNLKTQGKYSFKGSTTSQTLYTNYKFKGKTSYTFYVKNTGKYALTVKAKRLTKTYASTKISAGKSASVTFSDIKSTTEFYMTFEGSSFEGYIK